MSSRNRAETSPNSGSRPVSGRLAFGAAVLDPLRRELICNGVERHLRAKSFDVLAYLAQHAGRVVGKQELIDQVWDGVAVTDDSLVQCLMDIRRALEPDQEMIRTVRGKGYRFDAPVRHLAPDPEPNPQSPSGSRLADEPVPEAIARGRRPWSLPAAVILIGGLAVMTAVWRSAGPSGVPVITSETEPTLAPQVTMQPQVIALMTAGSEATSRRTQNGLQRGRELFQQAIALDGRYAPARAALANVLVLLSVFGVERPGDVLPDAEQHARRAVALDPTYALAWQALAHVQVQWTREWAAAESNYRRALALDPKAEYPAFLLAHLLMGVGRFDEAIAQSLAALEIDPNSALLNGSSGIVHYFSGRARDALPYFEKAEELDPAYSTAIFWHALALASLSRHDEAMERALRARSEMGNAPTWVVGYVHALAGRREEAREVLGAMKAHANRHYVPATEFAYLQLALGDRAGALASLRRAVDERSRWTELMAVDPKLATLRDTQAFADLLAELGLEKRP